MGCSNIYYQLFQDLEVDESVNRSNIYNHSCQRMDAVTCDSDSMSNVTTRATVYRTTRTNYAEINSIYEIIDR